MNIARYLCHNNRSNAFQHLNAVEFKQFTDYSLLPVQYGINIECPILHHRLSKHPWHKLECDTISYLFKHLATQHLYENDESHTCIEAPTHFQQDAWQNIKKLPTEAASFISDTPFSTARLEPFSIYCEIPHRDQGVSPCTVGSPCYMLRF